MNDPYLTVQQAADALEVHRATVYRWIAGKVIEAEEIAGHVLIRESVVTEKLKQRKGSQ